MLNSADLEYMRSAVEQLFPDTCNILSLTQTSNGQGGFTETWGTATAGVACRLDSASSKSSFLAQTQAITAGAIQEATQWMLSLPHDTTIDSNNRVEVSGYTFNVGAVDIGKSWNAEVRVSLDKI